MNNALVLTWADLLDQALGRFIADNNLNCPAAVPARPTRQERETFLNRIGVTPAECLGFTRGPAPVNQANRRLPQPNINLQGQRPDEPDLQFIERAEKYFRILTVPDAQAAILLENAAGSAVCAAIASFTTTPTSTLDQLLTHLRGQLKPSKSTLLRQIEGLTPFPGENISSFGQRLQTLYLRYIDKTSTDYDTLEPVLVHALVPILLKRLPAAASALVRQNFDTGTLVWADLCRVANAAYFETATKGADQRRRNGSSANSRPDACIKHPSSGHTNAECYTQHPERRPSGFTGRGGFNRPEGRPKNYNKAYTAEVSDAATSGNGQGPPSGESYSSAPVAACTSWWEAAPTSSLEIGPSHV
jgi:hypothetical protein